MARPVKVTDRNKRHSRRCSASREETLGQRKLREYFLIVTNGSETESRYFERIARKMPPHTLRQIEIKFHNSDPRGIVEHALEMASQSNYQHVAAVFDKDDFVHFDNAIAKMKAAEMRNEAVALYTAYSNECFELWMLLHFQNVHASLGRDSLSEKLQAQIQSIIGRDYRYKKPSFPFELLENPGNQQEAVRRAKCMLETAEQQNSNQPWTVNPTTEVHILMEKLNEFIVVR